MLLIQKSLLSKCLSAARGAYPNEFLGLLTGEKQSNGDILLTGLTVPPGLSVNSNSASYLSWMLPSAVDHWGIFHSHPGYSNRPSRADLLFASKEGGVSLIACLPYTLEDLRAYSPSGQPLEFTIA